MLALRCNHFLLTPSSQLAHLNLIMELCVPTFVAFVRDDMCDYAGGYQLSIGNTVQRSEDSAVDDAVRLCSLRNGCSVVLSGGVTGCCAHIHPVAVEQG